MANSEEGEKDDVKTKDERTARDKGERGREREEGWDEEGRSAAGRVKMKKQ